MIATRVRRRNWIERLLFLPRSRLAVDALSEIVSVGTASRDDIEATLRDYGIRGSGKEVRTQVWDGIVQQCLVDLILDAADVAKLEAARTLLGLTDSDSSAALKQRTDPLMYAMLASLMAKGHLTPQDHQLANAMAAKLLIGPQTARAMMQSEADRYVLGLVNSYAARGRVSDYDQQVLRQAIVALGASPSIASGLQATLDRAHRLWEIEQGRLPQVAAPMALQRGEVCHHYCGVEWQELRTRTVRTSSIGLSTSVRIVKGVRLRLGTSFPRRYTTEQIETIDRGTLFVTNKRVVVRGTRRNLSIPWRSVIALQPFADALVVEKASGRSPQFLIQGDTEMVALIASSALANS